MALRGVVRTVGLPVVLLGTIALGGCGGVSSLAANGLLRPDRRDVTARPHGAYTDVTWQGAGVMLKGWRFPAAGSRRGTVVYLHGVADNRGSAIGVAERFCARGFDVIAYDSRAHGDSGGDVCTYGYYEKQDLQRVLDTIQQGPIILIGTSLGAAVALQTAPEDSRVSAVIAAESFSDLRTVGTERAPRFFTQAMIRRAFVIAGERGSFDVDAVSPVQAAARIKVPVLLVHGALDRETPPAHSQRIFDALAGPKRLLIVDGVGHNHSLTASIWEEIQQWIESVIGDSRR
jgi:alpha-beta hydrolase superfamily lysophospholipase